MKVLLTHLTIEQWRIVVHIGYLHSEGADALKTGITLIGCLHSHRHKFTIITLTIEDFVCRDFTSLFVHGEFCAFLIRLLYNGVFNLTGCDRNMQNCLMIDTKLIIALRRCPQNTTCNFMEARTRQCIELERGTLCKTAPNLDTKSLLTRLIAMEMA